MIAPLQDARALAALHATCFDRPWSAHSFAELLQGAGVHALGSAEGFIMIRCVAGEAEILTLAVAPARRREGLARALGGGGMHLAASQYQVTHVFLEVAADNHGARALYAGLGFICHGRRKQYYANIDALMMRYALTQYDGTRYKAPAWDDEKEGGAQI